MKKLLTALTIICIIAVTMITCASAETVTGTTAQATEFKVHANSSSAYIVLSSSTGLAEVAQHNWIGVFEQYGSEKHHGFYKVTQKGNDVNRSLIWVPSATTNTSDTMTCEEIKLSFPSSGDYTITVEPISEYPYWRVDYIHKWIYNASWMATITSGCYIVTEEPTPVYYDEEIVTISIYKDGIFSNSFSRTIYSNTYIAPEEISGYTCISSGQTVTFDRTTGKCSPSSITFYYNKNTTSSLSNATSLSSRVVTPCSWDTQFKPGTATAICEGKIDNENKYVRLPNLCDNNASTSFWWLIWKSERTDSVPEITAYFDNDTVSSVGIRNGNTNSQFDYYKYARVRRFKIRIFYGSGYYQDTYITMNDNYSRDYQKFNLGGTYSNVTRIEFYLDGGANEGFYSGNSETYYIHIADMQFYN